MRYLCVLAIAAALYGCATEGMRSEATVDSGRPLSQGLSAYKVNHYTLRTELLIDQKSITGSATILFEAIRPMATLELDFDGLYVIEKIDDVDGELLYTRDESKIYIVLREEMPAGWSHGVTVHYHGKPIEAVRAPWDGGFVWSTTPSGKAWIATALQGEGCDIWWPCKDHPSGEPESLDIFVTVPAGLTVASNGILAETVELEGNRTTFHWRSNVPINTYGVALNVGPYVLIEDRYQSSNGIEFPVQFWAIEDHEEEAREFFEREFAINIAFFERMIGPYPWGQEKLGVAETPHYGMEHQTVNAYGNKFRRMQYGFDYILHHELAHEWFGNLMSHETISDMWLHEGFASYMQPEYSRQQLGAAAFHALMYRSYLRINACNPIAPREELSADQLFFDDKEGRGPAGDIYTKGAWLLHSLRYVIGEEALWRSIRRLVYDTAEPEELKPPYTARYRTTDDFVRIASDEAGQDLSWFFEVYARLGPLPVLSVTEAAEHLELIWQNTGAIDFPMPVPVRVDGEMRRIEFSENRAIIEEARMSDVLIDPFMQILRKLPSVPTCEERREEDADKSG